MNKFVLTLLVLGTHRLAVAQAEFAAAPQWQVALQVVDEYQTPVPGASVAASYYLPPPPNATEAGSRKTGLTDTNGFATLSAHSGPRIWCKAEKAAYYSSGPLEFVFSREADGRWQPWNPAGMLLLRKIGTPVPMYAKRIDSEPPLDGKPVGYDLTLGDWVAPSGKGRNADIRFLREYRSRSQNDYEYKLTVSFPNQGDGIQAFTVSKDLNYSGFRSPREAPQGGYESELRRENVSHPPATTKMDYDPNRNYFIRVRTVLDETGNIKSALYGKIYGDFMQFTYYLNPTPNDRNVEFDPKRNLLKGEQVVLP